VLKRVVPVRMHSAAGLKGITYYDSGGPVMKSILAVPILEGNGLVRGVLVADRISDEPFSERDEKLLVTRSGSNEYRGSAYEFHRNDVLDARNFFDPGETPPFVRNQYGAAIGGPVRKNQTFFFANYEGLRERKSVTTSFSTPDLAARQGQVKAEQALREAERLGKLLGKALVSEKAATVARQEAETARREAEAAARKAELFKRSGKALELDRLRAKVDEARAAARLAELELEAMTVRAPLAGRVTRMHVAAGQLVEKGAALVELEASQGVGASFALAPALAARVRPAMAFLLHDEATSRSFRGTIIAVGGGLDADSGLVRVEGVLELAGGAAPFLGETLAGEIITGRSPRGMIVPETALSVTDEGASIHVVDGGQKAHAMPVKVVATGGGEALVQGGGLKAGQPVVSDGNYNLPDGAGVKQERS
jgi:multidrug efflux pump subunit AcrA (membrane-fusion protein)